MRPYFYIIGWTDHNKWYMGVKYGKNANPETFWSKYFTSSKYVKEMKLEFGDPDVIWTYEKKTVQEALDMEIRCMKEMNVMSDDRWLNKNVGGAILMTPEIITKMKATLASPDVKEKARAAHSKPRKPMSEETKEKIRNKLKGKPTGPRSQQTKDRIRQSMVGRNTWAEKHPGEIRTRKPMSDATKEKIRQAALSRSNIRFQ